MKKMKLFAGFALLSLGAGVALSACGKSTKSESGLGQISVVSREEGSGTRGAFVDLFDLKDKNSKGETVDTTTSNAIVTNSTSVMLTTVSGDKAAIGYASLGALNNSVKVLKIDGKKASVKAIKNGSYKISRPFNIVTKAEISKSAKDFIDYVLSSDGQKIVEDNGYIPLEHRKPYQISMTSGKVVVSGSSSVTPVMEKLKEAYNKANPGVKVDIQQSDSSTGINDAIDGTSDIGMASRELENAEKSKGVSSTVIAMDGIALVVNKTNKVDNLTSQQVKKIFSGKLTEWEGLSE
ncbi:phosphate ABC transporter substrate-binding protein, PhoT family [Streptococcus equinus]|uniref:Phosphate ABC transporter substrate-binding protein, PhoT family n=1 Tax=Streptococcus equinus TaxID=1335 RepID=A0A1H0ZKF6_STREI|nr:substrate-binding domain-containing protein [Streptococcus equinus]SDQ27556.1 phosphate ABC transporter substrate-binding protein, PhoT family [Streptococcus equinus]